MSFFADIIHDSRRTIRTSKSYSNRPISHEAQTNLFNPQKPDDNVWSTLEVSNIISNQRDESISEESHETANISVESTKNSVRLDTQSIVESDHNEIDATATTSNINLSSDKLLTEQPDTAKKTAIDSITTHFLVNSKPQGKEQVAENLQSTESLNEPVTASTELDTNTPVAAVTDLVPEEAEGRVSRQQLGAIAGAQSTPNDQSLNLEKVVAEHSTLLTETNLRDKQTPENQKFADEQLQHNIINNLTPAFIEKQKHNATFHPDKVNRLLKQSAAPKVKIGQMNVVVETALVKKKAVKTEVSDNTSRAFLRSL
jgi:hypothetical protein